MITLPVSLMSIRSTGAPTKPAAAGGEASFGEILDRQVEASPASRQVTPDDAPTGRRPDPRRDPMTEMPASHAIDRSRDAASGPVDPATADATDDTGAGHDDDGNRDADTSAPDVTAAPDRHAPACPIAVPVDGVGQSLPAPSGQVPAEAAHVAEVAAVSGTAGPAAGLVAAAVDPLTTAAAALPSSTAGAGNGTPGPSGANPSVGDGLPVVTNVTVETLPVVDPSTATVPSAPTSLPPSAPGESPVSPSASPPVSPDVSPDASPVVAAAPGGITATMFTASPASTPAVTSPGAPGVVTDATPDASNPPAIGDATRVATPATPAPPTEASPVPATGQPVAAATPAPPATATAPVATAAAAVTAASADAGPAAPRPRTTTTASAGADATAPVTGAGSAPATAPGASAATADAATADGLVSAPLRTSDIAAQAQRDAQIRRAEHLTRLGVDVTTDGLGAIRIEATNAGGGLQLNLGAERASTRHLLAEQANVLRDELGTNVSVDIGRGNTGQHPSAGGDDPRRTSTSATHVVATARTVEAGAVRRPALSHLVDADRGLDLHL